jgi:FixJ family two-component response regulator
MPWSRLHPLASSSRPTRKGTLIAWSSTSNWTGGMSGFDLQERLTADGVNIPTIFITAHGDARTRESVKQSGVAGFLSKPFGDQALLDLIRRETCPA